ncbi:MAG TPA: hypothetical protein VGK19_22385 [Capsulimonadaceae bacterium]|jgi:hypothetical protein
MRAEQTVIPIRDAKIVRILFSDFFEVEPGVMAKYGAFNSSLVSDFPLFIDPFLLFGSDKPEYKALHDWIIQYLTFLRDKSSAGSIDEGLLVAWYCFKEVRQTWLGFSRKGNRGNGLNLSFARALNENFSRLFSDSSGSVTASKHLEKLCLIRKRVGKDNISDFTTNLIVGFLAKYTESFALAHLCGNHCKEFAVPRAYFNFDLETWEPRKFMLPEYNGDFVLLVPEDVLTREETWISKHDLVSSFFRIPKSMPNGALRAEINNYLLKAIPRRRTKAEKEQLVQETLLKYPEMIDYYIKLKEDTKEQARSISQERVADARQLFQNNVRELANLLCGTNFYNVPGDSYEEAHARIAYLKQVIEKNDGYRLFYVKGKPIQREDDVQIAYRLTWHGSPYDVNREVNNGRGPADFKVSFGGNDSTVVEFKLASNPQLSHNLKNQTAVYKQANNTNKSISVIFYFTSQELAKVERILNMLGIFGSPDVVLIDARRDNKTSASLVR